MCVRERETEREKEREREREILDVLPHTSFHVVLLCANTSFISFYQKVCVTNIAALVMLPEVCRGGWVRLLPPAFLH